MKVSKGTLILLSGCIWLLIGCFLLMLGTRFILKSEFKNTLFLALFALVIGYFKGKFVLAKSVRRQVARIQGLTTPTLRKIYSSGYYILILTMILLGISLKYLPISLYVRGAIDIAIGSALIQGALQYFRHFATYNIEKRGV